MRFFSAEEKSCRKGLFCTRQDPRPLAQRDGDGGGTAAMPWGHPHPPEKAARNNVFSTWVLAWATPVPSNDPFMPGKCNREFLWLSPAPESHQVSEGRWEADRMPGCRVICLTRWLLRGVLVAGRWHMVPVGVVLWAGVLHQPWPWALPIMCCSPAWSRATTLALLMCPQG